MLTALLDWSLIATVIGLLIGAAISPMSTPPFGFTTAKWCINAAVLILLIRVGWWVGIEHPEKMGDIRSVIKIVLFLGLLCIFWIGFTRRINSLHRAFYRITIKVLSPELQWREPGVRKSHTFHPDSQIPSNALLVLHLTVETTNSHPQHIKDFTLEMMGKIFRQPSERSWEPKRVREYSCFHLYFDIPPAPETYQARLTAKVLEEEDSKTAVTKYSPYFNVIIPETFLS